jgi:hypothetical protein
MPRAYEPKTYDALSDAERLRYRNLLDITATLANDARERLASKRAINPYGGDESSAAYAAMEECRNMLTFLGEGHTKLNIADIFKQVAAASKAAEGLHREADLLDSHDADHDAMLDRTAESVWSKPVDIPATPIEPKTDRIVSHISNRNASR